MISHKQSDFNKESNKIIPRQTKLARIILRLPLSLFFSGKTVQSILKRFVRCRSRLVFMQKEPLVRTVTVRTRGFSKGVYMEE